ncbi:MAG: SMP-30/gluconolactonase/LRE family protein [Rhizobiales bacterium]|nr:SMP-30/gluconolactonase/LRE family protein [Hyphomicrobiales bacterium]
MRGEAAGWQVIGEARDRLGESALWHPYEHALYWVDFYGPTIHRFCPANGEFSRWTPGIGGVIGSLAFTADGSLLIALADGLYLFDTATERLERFADPNGGRPGIGYNDAKVDRDGHYWVGTFDLKEREPRGILYRVGPSRAVMIADSGFVVCNGPAFSPDGATMYFSDTIGRRLIAYHLDRESGAVSEPRLFAEFGMEDGLPDGLCVDSAGAVYCAHYGGGRVTKFGSDGEQLESLPLPVRNVTSCCLGGPMLDTLFVTTAEDGGAHPLDGAIFARKVHMPGLPEPLFRMA